MKLGIDRSGSRLHASVAAGALLTGVLLAGCSSGGDDREELIAALMDDGGFNEAVATCTVDAAEEQFGLERLSELAGMSEEEGQATEEAGVLIEIMTDSLSAEG